MRGGLWVAEVPGKGVVGYVAFRHSQGWTRVAHLCVQESAKRQSVGRRLVELVLRVSLDTNQLGVRLKCRRDFPANEFWPKVGFVARGETTGRGSEPSELTIWVQDHNRPDLFSTSHIRDPDRLLAVIDANIFFELTGKEDQCTEETLALREPWIQDAVELCRVDELLNEINRAAFRAVRQVCLAKAEAFRELRSEPGKADPLAERLREILGWTGRKPQQESDLRQIAKAAAASAHLFLTRDGELLEASDAIEAKLSIRVLRPIDLICSIDQQERDHLYAPARLCGTGIRSQRCTSEALERVASCFQSHRQGETKAQFLAKARTHLAASTGGDSARFDLLQERAGGPLALVGAQFMADGVLAAPLLRVAEHRLAPTVARHVILSLVGGAVAQQARRIRICDGSLQPIIEHALSELYFSPSDRGWERTVMFGIHEFGALAGRLRDAGMPPAAFPSATERTGDVTRHRAVAEVAATWEARFWPVKVAGAGIESCVLPIEPEWARQLFDVGLAAQDLLDTDPERVLKRENVYYRSSRTWGPSPPARLLWYVKHDAEVPGTGCVRACSRLIGKEVAPAKDIFRKYRRLGIYEWKDLMGITKGDPFGPVMALHFTDTENFPRPVPLTILRRLGAARFLQSPIAVPEEVFAAVYRYGFGDDLS
ncbi:MAG TPA: GNAT family N-acetyltransferase [Verrucomicrobiae bacterium]|nr:GNAT family N-acetyltransferase [Verrucomicrobiae bacterium]